MRHMQEEDEGKYKSHFLRYIKEGITPDNLEQMYQDAHTKIRTNVSHDAKPKREDIKPMGDKMLRVAVCQRKWQHLWLTRTSQRHLNRGGRWRTCNVNCKKQKWMS